MTKHIAFFNIPAIGHIYPTLGVVDELVRRGHRVTYTSVPRRAEVLAAVGATLVPYVSTRPSDSDPEVRVPGRSTYIGESLLSFLEEAEATLPQLEPVYATDRPDLIVHDRMAFAARVLAEKLDVPTVELWPMLVSGEHWSMAQATGSFDPTDQHFLSYLARLDRLLHANGLATTVEHFLDPVARRHLAFYPRSFQYHGERFDEKYCFVGPCPRPRDSSVTRWRPTPDGRPVVLVTLGTINNLHPDFYRMCIAAFAESRWRLVLPVGERFDLAELGPVPPHVEVHRVVAQLDVLAHARAFVSHAGMGGVMEALAAGVPQLVIPFTPEQETNAARVVDLGLGYRLCPGELTASGLREAADRLAADRAMAGRLREMTAQLRSAGGAERAADIIEDCLV